MQKFSIITTTESKPVEIRRLFARNLLLMIARRNIKTFLINFFPSFLSMMLKFIFLIN